MEDADFAKTHSKRRQTDSINAVSIDLSLWFYVVSPLPKQFIVSFPVQE